MSDAEARARARRFTRQARLPEVGPEGQARLAATEARIEGDDFAAEVEARYLERAGLRVVRSVPPASPAGTAAPAPVRVAAMVSIVSDDPVARAAVDGAARAIARVLDALELPR